MAAIAFDLDGTLVDSAPDIAAAANRMLFSMGHAPLSLAQLTSFIGRGIPNLVHRVADMAFKARQFAPQRRARAKHRFGCRGQHRIARRQFADPLFEPATRSGADLEAEVPQQPAQ
ncbi:MAG: HAD hydrolase-like protein [Paracoccaceae bacterium]